MAKAKLIGCTIIYVLSASTIYGLKTKYNDKNMGTAYLIFSLSQLDIDVDNLKQCCV